jgi:hypothetical protein
MGTNFGRMKTGARENQWPGKGYSARGAENGEKYSEVQEGRTIKQK